MNKAALGVVAVSLLCFAQLSAAPLPANDPNCPGCLLQKGVIVEIQNGDLCTWAEFNSTNDDGSLFTAGVNRANHEAMAGQLSDAFKTSYFDKTAGAWKGDIVTIEFVKNGASDGDCASPGGTQIMGIRTVHRGSP